MTASLSTAGVDRGDAVVVLLPGIGGSVRHDFGFLLPMLARDRFVVGVDLPAAAPAEAAAAVRDALGTLLDGRRATLVGYSFGAAVALRLAGAAEGGLTPERLVLVGAWLAADERQRAFAASWGALARTPTHAAFARFAATGANDPLGADAASAPPPVATGPAADAHVRAIAELDLRAEAGRVTAPTLVVVGRDDQIAPRRQAAALLGAIADARLAEVHAGHAVPLERPAELLSLVEGFAAS